MKNSERKPVVLFLFEEDSAAREDNAGVNKLPTTNQVRVGRSTALGLRQIDAAAGALTARGSFATPGRLVSTGLRLALTQRHNFALGRTL